MWPVVAWWEKQHSMKRMRFVVCDVARVTLVTSLVCSPRGRPGGRRPARAGAEPSSDRTREKRGHMTAPHRRIGATEVSQCLRSLPGYVNSMAVGASADRRRRRARERGVVNCPSREAIRSNSSWSCVSPITWLTDAAATRQARQRRHPSGQRLIDTHLRPRLLLQSSEPDAPELLSGHGLVVA